MVVTIQFVAERTTLRMVEFNEIHDEQVCL